METQAIVIAAYVIYAVTVLSFYEFRKPDHREGRQAQKRRVSSFGYFYIWLYVSTLAVFVASLAGYDLFSKYVNEASLYIGTSISGLGTALFVAAKMKIGSHFSPCQDAYIPKDIVTDGLYRYIRHPIYSAFLLFFAGVIIVTMNPIVMLNLAILSYYYQRSAKLEEQELCEHFQSYSSYMSSTGRFFPSARQIVTLIKDAPSD